MKIIAGETTLLVKNVFAEKQFHKEALRKTLRINLIGGITDAQIEDLKKYNWQLIDENDNEQLSVQEQFDELLDHSITFVQVGAIEADNATLTKDIEVLRAENTLLKETMARASIAIPLEKTVILGG